MMYFYIINRADSRGYRPSGYVDGCTPEEAITKLCNIYNIEPNLAEIQFAMTKADFDRDMSRSWQGD